MLFPIYGDVVRTHPVTGRKMFGMINNELMLWLLCRPDLVPVVDFFYFPEDRVDGPSIVEAFNAGRTMVSYYGDAVLFEVDGETSGAKLEPGDRVRKMKVDAYAHPGGDYLVRIVRNGEVFEER